MTLRPRASLVDRVYALLLRVYPKRFRARFEGEMTEAVRTDHAEARAKGPGATAAFWTRTAAEAVVFGIAERRGAVRIVEGSRPSAWTVDWRDAFRALRVTPVMTGIAVLSLALGIGANTALFSILNSLILKPLPVQNPQQLVIVDDGSWTNPIWEQIRDRHVFSEAFAWSATRFNLSERGETDLVSGVYASGTMFDVLGVHARLGRTFTMADDARTGGPDGPVAVISYGFWQRRFGGAVDAIGRHVVANHVSFTIIGVTPRDFFGPDVGLVADIFVPLNDVALMPGRGKMLDGRGTWWLEIMGRLTPDQTIDAVAQTLRNAQPAIRMATLPQNWPAKDQELYLHDPLRLVSASTGRSDLRTSYAQPLLIILVVVGGVLVIACVNIANLLLARATARQREMSLRLALGASRARVARQMLAESLMLAVTGAVLGLGFAQWASALLVRQLATTVYLDLTPDWRVLGFTITVAMLTALIFGLAPAIGIARLRPNDTLRGTGRGVAGDRHQAVRHGLVIGQVALSLALVLGGALFLRTLASLNAVPLGFDADRLLVVEMNAPQLSNDAAPLRFAQIRDEIQFLPGVERAALSATTPAGSTRWNTLIEIPPGQPALSDKERTAWVNTISPGWFATYGTPLRQGRDVDARDAKGGPRVTVVNEAFAKKFLSGQAAIGAQVRTAAEDETIQTFQVVGVVGDAIYMSSRAGAWPTMYLPLTQTGIFATENALTVRAAGGSPLALMPAVGKAVTRDLPEATFTMRAVTDQLGATVRQERLVAILAGFFGGLALLLAALGLYGVTSYSVNRRRAEIGIRMALGADRAGVVRLVVGRVVGLVAIGIVAGAALSLWASQFVKTLLFNVAPRDPVMLVAASAILLGSAVLAGWLPARRAARVDPAQVLRET